MNSIGAYLKECFGEKVIKLSLEGGFTCPNRDGSKGTGGCTFCASDGTGHFAGTIRQQIDLLSDKWSEASYIAYFQNHTNTYAPVSDLREKYYDALNHDKVVGLAIATRPDCISDEALSLLAELNEKTFLWVELGLQTIHEKTASFIRRGYLLSCFEDAVTALHRLQIPVITHVILGLPGETASMQLQTISYLDTQPIWGIKLQLLHILKDTDLGLLYENEPYRYHSYETLEDYVSMVILCLEHLRPDIVVHRLTGDAPKELLLSPMWSLDKRKVLNTLHHEMKIHETYQGRLYAGSIDTL